MGSWHSGVWDGAGRVGRGPSSQKRQEAGTGQRVTGRTGATHPLWKKPTKAVLVRIVHPLADPEDGDAGGILGLLWDGNRQMIGQNQALPSVSNEQNPAFMELAF